jgi:hypothetical protein
MSAYIDRVAAMGACHEALKWLREAGHPTLEAAWAACPDASWLLWLAARCEPLRSSARWSDERRPLVLAACACARVALPVFEARYPFDDRPRRCIETTEAWCRGAATREDVQSDLRAADAAVEAARDAYAAAYAAYAASVAYAADDADAASAASAHAVYAAAAARAGRDCHRRMCAAIRAILPVPVLP